MKKTNCKYFIDYQNFGFANTTLEGWIDDLLLIKNYYDNLITQNYSV